MLRLVLLWLFSVLVFVSLGESMREAYRGYEAIAPSLWAAASGVSTACFVLAGAGIHHPLELLRLS